MIVVTGAAGFIGSNIVADLEARGRGPIAVVDWFGTDERWKNLAARAVDFYVIPEDVGAFLEAHIEEIEAVIHMGAISATTERDVDKLVANNINFTVRLWDWCAKSHVPFIYASSAATYGGIESDFIDDQDLAAINALAPLNAYGWSKKATDLIFARRIAQGKPAPPQWAGLKFFNVYGPNEYHKGDMMSVACKMFDQIMRGDKVQLFKSYRTGTADGAQRRDFVYVKDCTRAIVWLLDHPHVSGIFNIGSGDARSFLDIANAFAKILDRTVDIEFIEMPVAIRDRYQYFTQADMTKLRSSGMDAHFMTLEEGIADYASAYLARDTAIVDDTHPITDDISRSRRDNHHRARISVRSVDGDARTRCGGRATTHAASWIRVGGLTNQSGISRGYFDLTTAHSVNNRVATLLAAHDVTIDGWYICPHGAADGCTCRKPLPGLAATAAAELGLTLAGSWIIGDKRSDVEVADAIGGSGMLVETGHGTEYLDWARAEGRIIASDLADAASQILAL